MGSDARSGVDNPLLSDARSPYCLLFSVLLRNSSSKQGGLSASLAYRSLSPAGQRHRAAFVWKTLRAEGKGEACLLPGKFEDEISLFFLKAQ